MYKISKISVYILGIIGAILWIALAGFADGNDINNAPMQWMFIISYILLAIAILMATISGAKNIMSSPKALKKTLLYTGVFVVIVLVSYLLAMGESNTTEHWVSTGLIAFYILTAIATGLLIFTGVKNALIK